MAYRCIDEPILLEADGYQRALDGMTAKLSTLNDVLAVYQIGGVSTPGISDLDAVVVFRDNLMVPFDPRQGLSVEEKYMFVHPLYGLPIGLVPEAMKHTAFHNYRLLYGEDIFASSPKDEIAQDEKIQIALEFLLRMYILTSFEHSIGLFKIRSFLLHVKALVYDLEFLGIEGGPFYDLVHEIVQVRQNWFRDRKSDQWMIEWRKKFLWDLERFLATQLARHAFFLPGDGPFSYSASIELLHSPTLSFRTNRLFPRALSFLGASYVRFSNRLSRFTVECPFSLSHDSVSDVRFESLRKLAAYNREFLPGFYPFGTSLVISEK